MSPRRPIDSVLLQRASYAGLAITAAAVVVRQSPQDSRFGLLGMIAVAMCISDLTQLRLPRGGEFALSGGIATVAVAMLSPLAWLGALWVGALSAAAVRDTPTPVRELAVSTLRRLLALAAGWWVFERAWSTVADFGLEARYGALAALAGGLAYMAVDLATFALLDSSRSGRSPLRAVRSLTALVGGVYLSQVFVGAATTVVYSSLQTVAFGILFILMLLLQSSFGLLLRVRAAYMRTLSALARLAECQTSDGVGHSERVADLAATMARVRHLGGHDVELLSYAALLHNIGDVHSAQGTTGDLVVVGPHELFEDIPYLSGVGPVISASLVPHDLSPVATSRAEVLGGILRVACAYDASNSRLGASEGDSSIDFLAGPEFDPASVKALQTALVRQEAGRA